MTATLRVALGAWFCLALAGPAAADGPGRLEGRYVLSIGGLPAAEAVVDGAVEGARYAMRVELGTRGVVGTFYEAGLAASVEGAVEGERLAPGRFRSRYFDADKSRRVAMDYEAGAPRVTAEPAYDPKPWQLDPAEQGGMLDPLSALLAAFAPKPRGALCDRAFEIFDARRLYAIELGPPSGPSADGVIVCEAAYRRLGGFKEKMLAKPPFPFRVEFVEGEGGLWRLDRALGSTPIGTAVLARAD